MKVGTLEIELLANMVKLSKDMADARGIVESGMKGIESAVGSAKAALMGLAAGVVGGLTVSAFKGMVESVIEGEGALNDLSISTGVSVEALSGLAEVGALSDRSVQQIAGSMTKLAKNMSVSSEESKGTGKAIEALGINFDTFKTMKPDEQMMTLAKAMEGFTDGAGKAAIAQALWGKEGAANLPMMHDLAAVGELQATVTQEQAAQADNFGDNLTRLHQAGDVWKRDIVNGMLPAMNEFLQAFLDVNKGSNGVKKSIHDLSVDGSITQWTRNALNAASYVIDAFIYVKRAFVSVGEVAGALAASIATSFASTRDALGQALHGQFSEAFETMKKGGEAQKAIWGGVAKSMQDTWGETTLGKAIRDRAAELKNVAGTATETKKALDFVNLNDHKPKHGKTEAEKQADAYKQLVASIQEKINTNNLEVAKDRELTEAEKQGLEIQKLVTSGKISQAQASSAQTVALLAQLTASEKAKKQTEDLIKSTKEQVEANAKMFDDIVKGTVEYKKETETLHLAEQAYNLTGVQLRDLAVAKLEDKAASMEHRAAVLEDIDFSGKMSQALRDEAAAVRGLADEKRAAKTATERKLLDEGKGGDLKSSEETNALAKLKDTGELTPEQVDKIAVEKLRGLGVDPNTLQMGLDVQLQQLRNFDRQVQEMSDARVISQTTADQVIAQNRVKMNELQLAGATTMFSSLEGLANSNNKKLAAIGKAAAIADATIQGILAVQKALASGPPPWNYITAAAVGIAAAANVAKIAGVKGFIAGGYTGDGSMSGVSGVTHGREFVVNAQATAKNRPALESLNNSGQLPDSGGAAPQVNLTVHQNITVQGGSESSADSLMSAATFISKKTQADILDNARMGGRWAQVFGRRVN